MNERSSVKKKKKTILSNRLVRLALSLLYLLAAWIVLSRFGFLPAFLSLDLKQKVIAGELGNQKKYVQPDVKVNSPFYYTGDSFAKLMIDRDEPSIDPGAIRDLDILSNSNANSMGYYNADKDVYYFMDAPKVMSFQPGQKGFVSTATK